jgi:hypothetical protein
MAVADEIEALVTLRSGLTEGEIIAALYGGAGSPPQISNPCRSLLKSGRIELSGRCDPFRYFPRGLLAAPSSPSRRRRYYPF